MNKIWLIIQREFLSRVKKRSFLLVTILMPLLFPLLGFIVGYIVVQSKSTESKVVNVLSDSSEITLKSNSEFEYRYVDGPLDSAMSNFRESEDFALLHIPKTDIFNPENIALYAKGNISFGVKADIEGNIEQELKKRKLSIMSLSKTTLDSIKTSVSIGTYDIEKDESTKSNSGLTSAIGFGSGILIYMFLFVYGGQVMQGVIEEKNSKIVEVIVSTVKPFQLMMGKVLGIASVGVVQIFIWVVLIGGIYTAGGAYFSSQTSPQEIIEQTQGDMVDEEMKEKIENEGNRKIAEFMEVVDALPFAKIIGLFLFFFIGGFLLYGALFAAVGSAVDTPADAQQFMLPIMLPIIMGFAILFSVVQNDPNSAASTWLSIVPFFSPIVMMGRVMYAETWEILLSMLTLIAGFVGTIWFAGRIYRVGILMHGSKVNYKVLMKWFSMKN